jgi:hypothetical protein
MGRIVVMNHVTLDGVMQGPGRSDEDTRGGFTQGGWGSRSATPGDAAGAAMGERMEAGSGLAGWLFGRRTYESLLAFWNAQGGPFKDALNNSPKYVVSTLWRARCRGPTRRCSAATSLTLSPRSRRNPAASWRSWERLADWLADGCRPDRRVLADDPPAGAF